MTAERGFFPMPMTFTMFVPSTGTRVNPLSSMLISMIITASSRGTAWLSTRLTLPITWLSNTRFFFVSFS